MSKGVIYNFFNIKCWRNNIWNYTGSKLTNKSICVMPERIDEKNINCFGICSDYPYKYSKMYCI